MSSKDTVENPADGPMQELLTLLDLERVDKDLFRGKNAPDSWKRVYGGQVVGQALMAASMTVEDSRLVHSLHAYFMRSGDPQSRIIYQVERDRDGGSFSSRRVIAIQHGQPILNLAASFHVAEQGFHHQIPIADTPPPENLRSDADLCSEWLDQVPADLGSLLRGLRGIEYRPVAPQGPSVTHKTEPRQSIWFRATAPVPKDQPLQRAMLAYASDAHLLGTSLLAHGVHWLSPRIQVASLDHALWFHDDVDMEQWLLYVQDSPWSGGGRGINRGLIFTRSGRLIASVAQEGLIRMRTR